MTEGSRGAYGEGFVERAVAAADRVESSLAAEADGAAVARALCRELFAGVLGYDGDDCAVEGRVLRLRDADGHPAVTVAVAGRGATAEAVVGEAFAAAADEPYVRYLVAAGLDRLLVFERLGAEAAEGADDARTREGVTAREYADVPLGEAVAAGRRGPLSQTLRPGQQLAVAKLADLRPAALSAADRYGEFDAPDTHSIADDDGLQTLVGTLRDCVTDLLAPAVEAAQADRRAELDGYDEHAETLRRAVRTAGEGRGADGTAAGPARARLLAHERTHENARSLRAAYGTWVRGAGRTGFTPSENRRAFARVVALQLVEEALVARTLAGTDLLETEVNPLSGTAVERLEAFADALGVERDAGDLFGLAREAVATVYERRAPDLAGWALSEEEVSEALSRVVWYLDHFELAGDTERAALAYDRLLAAVDPPGLDVEAAEGPEEGGDPLPGTVLDRAGYEPGAAADPTAVDDLLDPAVGDGRYLLAAAGRLRDALEAADAEPDAVLETLTDRLAGASPDPLACRVTETRLLFRLLEPYQRARWEEPEYLLDPLPVHRTDPLAAGEGAPAALAREDYGYVVGAFPTTLRRDLPASVEPAYAEYETAHYTFDTSALYVERAAGWLAENGTLAARVAGRFRDTRFGTRLRERLSQWYRLEELRELPGVAAGGTPVLLVARRFRKNEPLVDPASFTPPTYGFTYAEGLADEGVELSSAALTESEWDWNRKREGGRGAGDAATDDAFDFEG